MFYTAKKRAEVAPGVGRSTDVHLILRSEIQTLLPEIFGKVEEIYQAGVERAKQGADADEQALLAFFREKKSALSAAAQPASAATSSSDQT